MLKIPPPPAPPTHKRRGDLDYHHLELPLPPTLPKEKGRAQAESKTMIHCDAVLRIGRGPIPTFRMAGISDRSGTDPYLGVLLHALPGDLPGPVEFPHFQLFDARTFQQVGAVVLPEDRSRRIGVGADPQVGNADSDIFAAVAHGCLVADPLLQVHSLGAEIRGVAGAISGQASGFPAFHPAGDQFLGCCPGCGFRVRDLSRRTGDFLNNRRRGGFVIQD